MDFFDEDDDAPREPRRRGGGRPPGPSGHSALSGAPATRQQARARQAAFLVGTVIVLILLVIAFRGCLNARADRAFQNYVSDLSSITAESDQLSKSFFDRLEGKSSVDGVTFQTEVDGDKGTVQALLDRAEGLDAPDELGAAQEQIELAFELRRDALEGIAAQVGTAQSESKNGSDDASSAIYTQMRVLSASDILYARARDQIEQGLEDQEVTVEEGVPSSQFLPDEPDYLDPGVVDSAVSVIAGGSGESGAGSDCDPGDSKTHGLGLVDGGASLQPSGTVLDPATPVTAPQGDDEVEIQVQNQGNADESDISVDVSAKGDELGSQVISSIAAGETQSVTIPLQPTPSAGDSIELDVNVATVCGEQVDTNNKATYSITF